MAKVRYPLETAMDAYGAIVAGHKVVWTNDRGTFEITIGDPIYEMICHMGGGSTIYGFWKEMEK